MPSLEELSVEASKLTGKVEALEILVSATDQKCELVLKQVGFLIRIQKIFWGAILIVIPIAAYFGYDAKNVVDAASDSSRLSREIFQDLQVNEVVDETMDLINETAFSYDRAQKHRFGEQWRKELRAARYPLERVQKLLERVSQIDEGDSSEKREALSDVIELLLKATSLIDEYLSSSPNMSEVQRKAAALEYHLARFRSMRIVKTTRFETSDFPRLNDFELLLSRTLTRGYYESGKMEEALRVNKSAYEKLGHWRLILERSDIRLNLMSKEHEKSDPDAAMRQLSFAEAELNKLIIALRKSGAPADELAATHRRLGNVFYIKKEYELAKSHWRQAYENSLYDKNAWARAADINNITWADFRSACSSFDADSCTRQALENFYAEWDSCKEAGPRIVSEAMGGQVLVKRLLGENSSASKLYQTLLRYNPSFSDANYLTSNHGWTLDEVALLHGSPRAPDAARSR